MSSPGSVERPQIGHEARHDMTVLAADVLAPGGGLARAIPHYEDRAEQRAMSAAIDERSPIRDEAPTT